MTSSRKKIGLALSVGGAKGLFHLGVLKALKEAHIPIDYISGSSSGSLVAGLYSATNQNLDAVEDIINSVTYRQLFKFFFDPAYRGGLIKGQKMIKFLDRHLGNFNIKDLPIPLSVVSTDLLTGQPYIFTKGKLSLAIRASCSIPFIFSPIYLKKHVLIDGGASLPVPAVVVKDMGADIVIASNIHHHYVSAISGHPRSRSVITASVSALMHQLSHYNCQSADFVIHPPTLKKNPILNFTANKDLISLGQSRTENIIPQLKKLL